jgi:hypothetical protein
MVRKGCMVGSVREARRLRLAQRIYEDPAHPLHRPRVPEDSAAAAKSKVI